MGLTKIEKTITEEIRKHRRIRWSDLKSIIVDELKIISERPFRETLNELVKKGVVFKQEFSNKTTEYSVERDIINMENNIKMALDTRIPELKRFITEIEKNRSKIPITDLAGYIVGLWGIVNHFEYSGEVVGIVTNTERTSRRKECEEVRIQIIEMIMNSKPDDMLQLFDMTSQLFYYGAEEALRLIHQDLAEKNIKLVDPTKNTTS